MAIDIEKGSYELGDDELAASDSLLARLPQGSSVASARGVTLRSPLQSAAPPRAPMITGAVNTRREAIVRLRVQVRALTIQVVEDGSVTIENL